MVEEIYVVDIIKDVIASMQLQNTSKPVGTFETINYVPGRSLEIVNSLILKDNSSTKKATKYPLFAMLLPIIERNGSGYNEVTIERIVMSTITPSDKSVTQKYESTGTFKTLLYPFRREFFKRLAMSTRVMMGDPDAFVYRKLDNPSVQPLGGGSSDFIDSIEITNLELTLSNFKTC